MNFCVMIQVCLNPSGKKHLRKFAKPPALQAKANVISSFCFEVSVIIYLGFVFRFLKMKKKQLWKKKTRKGNKRQELTTKIISKFLKLILQSEASLSVLQVILFLGLIFYM